MTGTRPSWPTTRSASGAAVGELLADPDRAERMGGAGRVCAAPQRWERTLEPVVEAYRRWL